MPARWKGCAFKTIHPELVVFLITGPSQRPLFCCCSFSLKAPDDPAIIKKRLPETEGSAGKWRGQMERRAPDGNVWVPDPAIPDAGPIPELFSYMKQEICTSSPFFC